MTYDVVVIGAGLGGLQCARALARRGMSVCVLEQGAVIGGCLQTFRRGGLSFDTGFHYVGGMDAGQPLSRVMNYFGLGDLPWHRLDADGFDEVVMAGRSYRFPMGYERFAEAMAEHFPAQRGAIDQFTSLMERVAGNVLCDLEGDTAASAWRHELFGCSAYEYLRSLTDDTLLLNVLSGASMKMEPDPQSLPLYVFAQTNGSYLGSAWRLKGGGSQVADALAGAICSAGGTVMTRARVTELRERDGAVTAARLADGTEVAGRRFISDIHPAATLHLLPEAKQFRPSYRRRIDALGNTFGAFTVNIALKPGALPYLNRNLHIHARSEVWSHAHYEPERGVGYVLASYAVPPDGAMHAMNIDLLTPMHWEEVSHWEQTTVGRRGEEYAAFKQRKAEECIALAAEQIPGLREAIDTCHTSTPLTWRDYTGTPHGSAYGIRKDYHDPGRTILPARTPLGNLFMTGQNLAVHGILGVSMSALTTCAQLLGGMGEIATDFKQRT